MAESDINFTSKEILKYTEGSLLLNENEVIILEHRVYLVNISFEEYFEE